MAIVVKPVSELAVGDNLGPDHGKVTSVEPDGSRVMVYVSKLEVPCGFPLSHTDGTPNTIEVHVLDSKPKSQSKPKPAVGNSPAATGSPASKP